MHLSNFAYEIIGRIVMVVWILVLAAHTLQLIKQPGAFDAFLRKNPTFNLMYSLFIAFGAGTTGVLTVAFSDYNHQALIVQNSTFTAFAERLYWMWNIAISFYAVLNVLSLVLKRTNTRTQRQTSKA